MLIGEHDPLTGFNVLRSRYVAGARPSEAIDGWALTYLLTRDENFAKKAVEEMRRTHPPDLVGSRTYPEYVKWSLAFDWLYNYPGFDAQLKDRVALELLKAAEKMMEDQSLKEVQLAMYQNYPVRYLTLAVFALTAIEGHPSAESRAAPLRTHAQEVFDHILDLTNFVTPDGGYHESMDYQRITYAPLALLAELRRTASNNDPARRYTVFHHYTDTYLYKVLPDGTSARDDDGMLRTLAILEQYSFDDLRQCAPLTYGWRRRGLAVPLLLTEHEFMRTLDVFPLEYGSIIASHIVIAGDEPFAHAHVSAADRRRGCEHQAKSHLVHLREGFLETGGDARDVAALIGASAPAFRSLLLNLAQLDLDRPDAAFLHDHELAAITEQTIGVPGVLVTEILTSPVTLGTVADPMALLSRYIDASERIWAFLDRLRS